jgi:phage baseplate assembly protein W
MPGSFLGTGWGFPPTFDPIADTAVMTSDEVDIQQSLNILLSTRLGERVMVPDYGCNLDEMLFEPMTTTFKTHIAEMVRFAIIHYEARINLNSVTVDDTQEVNGVILLVIDYSIATTNSRFNFVYPYYLKEGTELH